MPRKTFVAQGFRIELIDATEKVRGAGVSY